MAKSVKDRLIEALVAGGGAVVPCRSLKYTEVVVGDQHYFVGKCGGLRFGRTASESLGCSDQFRAKLLARSGS